MEGYGPEYTVFSLEDVVMDSKEAAKKLANKLDVECGLFCDEYHG